MIRNGHRLLWLAGSLVVLVGIVGLWSAFSNSGILPRAFFPGPERAWAALVAGVMQGTMLVETAETILRMVYGWVLASFIGIALGSIIGISPWARTYVAPMLEAIRPLPASAVAPVLIVLFGMTNEMIVILIAFGSLWPMLLTTVHGFANVHPRLREVSRSLAISRWDFVRKVALPNALPDIMTGLRLGLTIALILAVVGEMITVQGGLGSRILMAARSFRSPDIFAGVLLLGLIGLASNVLLTVAERRLLRWRPH
ncbi:MULTISPECIES: ABC transporter permease [unclassified Beijerinckia]|uniref:ABC transporter permease n=1 Tax=unclassified Beijerinckia TaxID=2638183 RepID=UPI00089636D8|nr:MULTISPECIES: ABC transporter permease [unclassified Beijerinckia]MDH7794260.1 sulfonate transport system permease protein [Beijerinckia sp. GAS462]SEB57091.1 ABC-type nitrate/sulfonate/bicarbonate transport system, permease component [Beijerinckia sp. 28-YEA-48]